MQRIPIIDRAAAAPQIEGLLATVEKQMGRVPNVLATMAHSPAALGGFVGLSGALAEGCLPAALREQVALAVAGANGCDYCASAHTALAGRLGIAPDEAQRNLAAESAQAQVDAVLKFTGRLVENRGRVTDADLATVREAGFGDPEIVEIVANTALNLFTNYFNHVAETEIDFPAVATADLAAA